MKTFSTLILLLLSITNLYSQEWQWRNLTINQLKYRHIKFHNYTKKTFNEKADFRKSEFDSVALFNGAKFHSVASFNQARFHSKANFSNSHFDSVWFYRMRFDSLVLFERAHFNSIAFFKSVSFKSSVSFSSAHFHHFTDFIHTKFYSDANFFSVAFTDTCLFKDAKFYGEVNFDNDTLPGYLDFSDVTVVKNKIDLTRTIINPKYGICHINLTDANIEKFRLMYKGFKLWFPQTDSINYEKKANVYVQLLNVQKKEGFTESYQILDKEYKAFQYTDPEGPYQHNKFLGVTLNWVNKNWWGYGFNKELIIRNVILILLLLSFINSFILKYLTTHVYRNERIKNMIDSHKQRSRLARWFVSMRYSLFYTAIIFFSFKFDMEKLNYTENLDGWKILNLIYFMIIYLGGLICLAYLANYIITV